MRSSGKGRPKQETRLRGREAGRAECPLDVRMLIQLSVVVVVGSLAARRLLGARWVPAPRPGVWLWAAMTVAAAAHWFLLWLALLSLLAGADAAVPLQELFKAGKADGAVTGNPWVKKGTPVTYRIPALVATNSTLIAFASERLGSTNDESATNLVQRRSTDGGESWGRLTLVVESAHGMSSAPWAIADDRTSQVLLFWNQNSTADQKCSCGVAMVQGKDGADYSAPVWLPADSGVAGSSLDSGIRLQKGPHAGRLLVCACSFEHRRPHVWHRSIRCMHVFHMHSPLNLYVAEVYTYIRVLHTSFTHAPNGEQVCARSARTLALARTRPSQVGRPIRIVEMDHQCWRDCDRVVHY